jgi:DNA-binding transcriptional ArsR family regulator
MPYTLQNFKAEFFKALAHPVRIRILEVLRDSEKSVTEIQSLLELDQSTVSQQLSILRSKSLLQSRKSGTSVFYSVRDPMLFDLLDIARSIFNNQLIDTQELLFLLDNEKPVPPIES